MAFYIMLSKIIGCAGLSTWRLGLELIVAKIVQVNESCRANDDSLARFGRFPARTLFQSQRFEPVGPFFHPENVISIGIEAYNFPRYRFLLPIFRQRAIAYHFIIARFYGRISRHIGTLHLKCVIPLRQWVIRTSTQAPATQTHQETFAEKAKRQTICFHIVIGLK